MIAITGQLDGIAAAFSRTLARSERHAPIIGLGRAAACGWGVDTWRLGSMTSERDTQYMLADVSTAFYFCLTPPNEGRTHEGLGYDVALCDAINFAHCAGDHVRVVLVTRFFPNDGRNLGNSFAFWREVCEIFKENVTHLQIVQTTPVWSEFDAVVTGLISYAQHQSIQDRDVRFFNLVNPTTMKSLQDKLVRTFDDWQDGAEHLVEGDIAVSYGNLVRCVQNALNGRRIQSSVARMITRSRQLGFDDETLFKQAVEFHSAGELAMYKANQTDLPKRVFERCRDFVADQVDVSIVSATCSRLGALARTSRLKVETADAPHARNYVYRIARLPKRPVSEIADLFVEWLPRYFQRLVHLEKLGETRQMVRLSRVPLVEFEKCDESWQRCRLVVRWPLGNHVQARTQLITTVTGTREKPRELLIVCEEGTEGNWFVMLSRGILAAFGTYLRDYGVAEA